MHRRFRYVESTVLTSTELGSFASCAGEVTITVMVSIERKKIPSDAGARFHRKYHDAQDSLLVVTLSSSTATNLIVGHCLIEGI